MATKISTITELFHRFHNCEMQLKQGKIAACLINFKEVIEKSPAIPKTEKEKSELHAGIATFLKFSARCLLAIPIWKPTWNLLKA